MMKNGQRVSENGQCSVVTVSENQRLMILAR